MGLKLKVFTGYAALLVLLGCIFCIFLKERKRSRLQQYKESTLLNIRKNIGYAYIQLLDLASYGEVSGAWDRQDALSYDSLLRETCTTLARLKGMGTNPVQKQRIDSITVLLHEKKRLLGLLSSAYRPTGTHEKILKQRLPALLTASTKPAPPSAEDNSPPILPQPKEKKRNLFQRIFGRKEHKSAYRRWQDEKERRTAAPAPSDKRSVTVSPTQVAVSVGQEFRQEDRTRLSDLKARADSLYLNNRRLNSKLTLLVAAFEEEVVRRIRVQEELFSRRQQASFRTLTLLSVLLCLLAAVFYVLFHRDFNRRSRYRKQLEESDRSKNDLLRQRKKMMLMLAHDIRGPLNSIDGSAELALDTSDKTKRDRYIGYIRRSSTHILHLVNNLLDVCRLNEGKDTPNFMPFQLEPLLKRIAGDYEKRAKAKGLQFTVELAGTGNTVMGDADRIEQITDNLLSNALKFTEEGAIVFTVEYKDSLLSIEVTDTGPGMDGEQTERIFRLFERSQTEGNIDGYGLGLPIVKGLVRLLNGEITVSSKRGEGSCFKVLLPLKVSAEKEPDGIPEVPTNTDLYLPSRVIAIDDDPLQLEILKELLERNRISCTVCVTTGDLFRQLRQADYDLLLTDIQMGGTNGYGVLKRLRLSPMFRNLPVIAMTAREDKDENGLLAAGFSACIYKPFSMDELLEKVSAVMRETGHLSKAIFERMLSGTEQPVKLLRLFIGEIERGCRELERAEDKIPLLRETVHRLLPMLAMVHTESPLSDYRILLHGKTSPAEIKRETLLIIHYLNRLAALAGQKIMKYETENIDS